MKKIRTMLMGLAATGALAGSALAESHGGELPMSVKARQSTMTLYAFNLGTLGAMAQEKIPYDAEAASAAAANLAALTSMNQGPMWAPGTSTEDLEGTRALPKIWTDMEGVIENVVALNEAAAAMETAAGEGLDSLKAAMGPLGSACGDCHKAYREPD